MYIGQAFPQPSPNLTNFVPYRSHIMTTDTGWRGKAPGTADSCTLKTGKPERGRSEQCVRLWNGFISLRTRFSGGDSCEHGNEPSCFLKGRWVQRMELVKGYSNVKWESEDNRKQKYVVDLLHEVKTERRVAYVLRFEKTESTLFFIRMLPAHMVQFPSIPTWGSAFYCVS